MDATIEPMRKALSDANLTYDQIDKIILVGGSTRIPAVQEAVKNFMHTEPSKGINPDAVSYTHLHVQVSVDEPRAQKLVRAVHFHFALVRTQAHHIAVGHGDVYKRQGLPYTHQKERRFSP